MPVEGEDKKTLDAGLHCRYQLSGEPSGMDENIHDILVYTVGKCAKDGIE